MLRSYLAVAGVTVSTIALSVASMNCGSSAEGTGGNASGGTTSGTGTEAVTGTGTGSGPHADPPPPPSGGTAPDGTSSTVMAVSKLYLGDTDADGTPDKTNGWKHFGYDLDGKISTATSTDLCKPLNLASPKSVYPDGDEGIDNSFGKNILPIILGLESSASTQLNDSIAQGKFTLMLSMEKLGTGANYTGLKTQLYAGSDLGAAPKWDGNDKWPLTPEFLADATATPPLSKVVFATSYVNNNTWVSGSKGDVTLALSIGGFTLNLTIANAVITVQMDAAHQKGSHGIIAGVLSTDQLTGELKKVAGNFDQSLCSGPTIDSIVSQIEQASDILKDGTQDATKPCDGISIGLGFDASVVQLGPVAPPSPPGQNKCADAGP